MATTGEHQFTNVPSIPSFQQDRQPTPITPNGEDALLRPDHDSQTNNRSLSPTKETFYPDDSNPGVVKRNRRTLTIIALGIVGLALIAVAVAVPVALTVGKNDNKGSSSSSSSTSGSSSTASDPSATSRGTPTSSSPEPTSSTSGRSGTLITLDDGSTFTYVNDFEGEWAYDPKEPFAPGGKAQSWSPRVGNEEWDWSKDFVRGVNLGGWLVTEPFIVPGLYQKWLNNDRGVVVEDEWTLSLAMGDSLAEEMETHYRTFITERDFADIAAAGLNWVRIPIGYWAVETMEGEPFLAKVSWQYFLKAIQWARKYGLRIYCDLHALPGSQNAWNHSGKSGSINMMSGVMGIANAQRTLNILRSIVQFVSQPQYKDVVLIVGTVNEIRLDLVGRPAVESFYNAAYDAIRKATGTGAGNGPYIAIHEGFRGPAFWAGFLSGSDRVILDQHPYLAFTNDATLTPENAGSRPCSQWAMATNESQRVFGVTVGGEFSSAINNCALWLNGIPAGINPACRQWDDWASWSPTLIDNLKQVTLATMDSLQNWFYWTWKIGNSTVLGGAPTSTSPMWHYKLGLERGWVPKDPREATGHCARILGQSVPFDGNFPSTATGRGRAGTLDATYPFPPATMSPSFSGTDISLLPTYTPTGTLVTLPAATFTDAPSVDLGTGWNNPVDNVPAYVPVEGCSYPNAWDAVQAPLPIATCTGR